ncbi:TBC domain-containing protein [Magnaporthiopsis poae ATCC 64411]|uniref:TBC domain-containing protein n=1 Tax=Magnaporthiopsis poae (strain ATCC 64411 / 73-15) TaxID=644358 RepID=A0A0C4DWI5_MAGP6|nr:TBC domain-containing protein [Magnaporthiopsis poae ATCC 64411]
MAPHKLTSASLRYKNKPAAARIAPFRDDTSLVAFRYEHTLQAKPPIPVIPVPPRNPARTTTRPVSVASGTTVIVAPPPISPNEQHPAFRTRDHAQSSSAAAAADDGKRDSVLAPATPASTIHEECEDDPAVFARFNVREPTVSILGGATSFTTRISHETAHRALSTADIPSPIHALFESPRAAPIPTPPRLAPGSSSPTGNPPVSFSRAASRTMTRAFSLRPASSGQQPNRLRKKSLSKDAEEIDDAPSSPLTGGDGTSLPQSRGSSQLPGLGGGANQDPCPPSPPRSQAQSDNPEFLPITTAIPTDSLLEDDFLTQLTFSHRGSVMFGGKRAVGKPHPHPAQSASPPVMEPAAATATTSTATSAPSIAVAMMEMPNIRILAVDMERESQKVRSLYGPDEEEGGWVHGGPGSSFTDRPEPIAEVPSDGEVNAASRSPGGDSLPPHRVITDTPRPVSSSSLRRDNLAKREFELAGGIEDWEDVDGADVDRFGFISPNPRRSEFRGDAAGPQSLPPTPRKRNVLVKRMDPAVHGSASLSPGRGPTRKVSARSLNTQASELSATSRRSGRSSVRAAANLLPHNRDRRLMDEAAGMLTLAPGLSDILEDEQVEKMSEAFKRKEWERTEKWRKMAKVSHKGQSGQGMEFQFDPKNAKVVDRTWKGIPDCWRAAAWYSFLTASARQHGSNTTDEQLTADFQRLQAVSSADDTQIDLDVPRTINRHIMFRRRYRGGQRLLFRVLHALSLYFPETGYVQGMASLAATMLCYYDEEKAFVMLVLMWRFRGLERLYEPGFGSLMTALKDFEKDWLRDKEVAHKLTELCIDPTAYATRWYLTLFNLSVPFPAQLRVWDVIMLLGEPSPRSSGAESSEAPMNLDILHAAAAAIIHALAEVLLDSDFENAMKALTSWVPIKDEELLMKITRAEWKLRQGKKKA